MTLMTSRRDCPKLINMVLYLFLRCIGKRRGRDGDNTLPHALPLSSLPASPSYSLLLSSLLSVSFYSVSFPRFLVPGLSTPRQYALAFQAGSPNVSEFSLAILRLNEQGFLGKLTRKWWDNANNCPVEQTTSE